MIFIFMPLQHHSDAIGGLLYCNKNIIKQIPDEVNMLVPRFRTR